MKNVLRKEDLFYDLAALLTKNFAEPKLQVDEDGGCRFSIDIFETVPKIDVEIFLNSTESEDLYEAFAKSGKKVSNIAKGDTLFEVTVNLLYDFLPDLFSVTIIDE